MNSVQITAIVIIILYFLIFLGYLFSVPWLPKDIVILFISVLFIISIFLNFMQSCPESFYFEVSPQRKKCLEEQVSLTPRDKRSCSCCQKGTVGGYPPNYEQWFQPNIENYSLWQRADNWTTNPRLEGMIPPTELVGPVENYSGGAKKPKRSQIEMYTQQF